MKGAILAEYVCRQESSRYLAGSDDPAFFCDDLDEGSLARADSLALLDTDTDVSVHHPRLDPQTLTRHADHFAMGGLEGISSSSAPMNHVSALSGHLGFASESDSSSVFENLAPAVSFPGVFVSNSPLEPYGYLPQNVVVPASQTSAVDTIGGFSADGHALHCPAVYSSPYPSVSSHASVVVNSSHQSFPSSHPFATARPYAAGSHSPQQPPPYPYSESDPAELERFAERFKQRRIKLGVTQADVGSALAQLKIPGVGSLSQSTICRFESLTLSHNNMVALRPVLLTWLQEAEQRAARARHQQLLQQQHQHQQQSQEPVVEEESQKRRRTSITLPEKRSLEAYFAVQPRPSGDRIAQIASRLDLKKNVVRVWFCNQRQKQKRLKFSAVTLSHY